MKTTIFTILFNLILFTSCITIHEGGPESYARTNEQPYDVATIEDSSILDNEMAHESGREEGLFQKLIENRFKTHEFRDARTGLVVNSAEYPASWNVISRPTYTIDQKLPVFLIQTTGPNNLKSFNTPMKVHIAYQNPQTYQFMQNATYSGMHRPLASNQQILQDEVQSRMQKSGFTYVKDLELTKSQNYLKEKIAESGGQVQMDLLSTIWENDKGQTALVNVGKIYMRQPLSFIDTMTLWMYSVDYTFVDTDHFEETIATFENALVNSKENPQWVQYVAQLNQQRAQESARNHQINMQNRQAAFNAHQQKMKGIWAAQDANHASFMNRNFGAGSNTSQQNFVNMINEEETVYNPLNGKNYQVNAFSSQNWMDSDGNLVQNDDLFYTPNGDINLNNREWVKVKSAY